MIIETVVTTLDETGAANFAAMGVVWGEERITIRPFTNTRTYRNLARAGEAVVSVTDNVLIFAKSALSRERFESMPARQVRGVILRDACYWREVVVQRIVPPDGDAGAGRAEILAKVVGGGELRPFAGFCRAKHAVIEASILASRLRLLPEDETLRELDRLDALVDRTGGPDERRAMDFIRAYVTARAAGGAGGGRG